MLFGSATGSPQGSGSVGSVGLLVDSTSPLGFLILPPTPPQDLKNEVLEKGMLQ